MNSRRVDGLSRKAPSMRLVSMVTPVLWMTRGEAVALGAPPSRVTMVVSGRSD